MLRLLALAQNRIDLINKYQRRLHGSCHGKQRSHELLTITELLLLLFDSQISDDDDVDATSIATRTHLEVRDEADIEKKVHEASDATALANMVLPAQYTRTECQFQLQSFRTMAACNTCAWWPKEQQPYGCPMQHISLCI